jgi:N-methylhydantoinase A
LREGGFSRDLLVMNGNGGTVPASHVVHEAAKTVMSGIRAGAGRRSGRGSAAPRR